jgi:integrase
MILMPSHPEEVWALVRVAGSDQGGAMYLTAGFTGLRMGELRALQWRDVNYSGETIRVRRSYNVHGGVGSPKSGRVRSVPMVPDVAQRLAALAGREFYVEPEDLVFANELGTFQDASSIRIRYRAALARAGLPQLRFDDLRHSFGTLAVRRAEVPAVQAWMAHSDIQTTTPAIERLLCPALRATRGVGSGRVQCRRSSRERRPGRAFRWLGASSV